MPALQIDSLSEVSETLLIPLCFRALESKEPNPIVFDQKALAIVSQIAYDFAKLEKAGIDRVFSMMRCREFDHYAKTFLTEHPAGSVVEIGCGLGDRLSRIDQANTAHVNWYNLDLPEVMAIRAQLLGNSSRSKSIAGSVLDSAWLSQVTVQPGEKVLFLAEGVLPYFAETDVKRLVQMLCETFSGCELVFDALSPFMIRFHQRGSSMKDAAAQLRWAVANDRDLERWGNNIRLLESWRYFDQPEPRLRAASLMRYIPPLARGSRILRYQLGMDKE
jgi:O-methyltransferase involved in polyketide biosynthesis